MMYRTLGAFLLVCLMFPAVLAADITFTAGQQDYYILVGQPVEIPLGVMSSYPQDMTGTVRFSTDTQLQKTGVVMISTENRVYSHTVPPGRSFLNLSAGSPGVPMDFKVHFSFYYTDVSIVNASVPELYIHVVSDPGQVRNVPLPVTSTGRPETGSIPASSSVHIVEQTVSIRQQMGSDSTGVPSIASGQSQQDAEAARQQEQRDKERREREQREFDERLGKDPLFVEVHESLGADGFTRRTLDTQPAGNGTGTFSMVYRRGATDQVVVLGSMHEGVVPSVREASNAEITADPALAANTTFQSFNRMLREQGYGYSETTINLTLTGAIVSITYATPGGNKAYVNATTENNRVGQVTMEQETGPAGFPLVPVLIVAMVLVTVLGGYMYWRYERRRRPTPSDRAVSLTPAFDHRVEAERILNDARLAFVRQQYADAYGLASRALRVFLSYELGNKGEVTTAEIVSLLRTTGQDASTIEALLLRCDGVVFARQEPDTGEFSSMVSRIREIIRP